MKIWTVVVLFAISFVMGCTAVESSTAEDNSSVVNSSSTSLSFISYDSAFVTKMLGWADDSVTQLGTQLNVPSSLDLNEVRYVYLSYTDQNGKEEVYYYLINFDADGNSSQAAFGFVSINNGETDGAFVYTTSDQEFYDSLNSSFDSLFAYSATPQEVEVYNLLYGQGFDIRRGILTVAQLQALIN